MKCPLCSETLENGQNFLTLTHVREFGSNCLEIASLYLAMWQLVQMLMAVVLVNVNLLFLSAQS